MHERAVLRRSVRQRCTRRRRGGCRPEPEIQVMYAGTYCFTSHGCPCTCLPLLFSLIFSYCFSVLTLLFSLSLSRVCESHVHTTCACISSSSSPCSSLCRPSFDLSSPRRNSLTPILSCNTHTHYLVVVHHSLSSHSFIHSFISSRARVVMGNGSSSTLAMQDAMEKCKHDKERYDACFKRYDDPRRMCR